MLTTACVLWISLMMAPTQATAAEVPATVDRNTMAVVPAGRFVSILLSPDGGADSAVASFRMERRPVTQGEFLVFVRASPQWQRNRVPSIFADGQYLSGWQDVLALGPGIDPDQPVTAVSWFAARAYCESRGARLPTWLEWEYVAAADETRPDARTAQAWQQEILGWYSRPSTLPLPKVGQSRANFYGVRDMHGLVWEWVEDFNGFMMSADAREAGDADALKFCGGAALGFENREEYATAMRVAMLSALKARDTTGNLGFRCVTSVTE